MDIRMHKFSDKVPEPTLRRLPWYLSNVKLMKEQGETYVSSTQISKQINVDASQIAKDLSYVNISGCAYRIRITLSRKHRVTLMSSSVMDMIHLPRHLWEKTASYTAAPSPMHHKYPTQRSVWQTGRSCPL